MPRPHLIGTIEIAPRKDAAKAGGSDVHPHPGSAQRCQSPIVASDCGKPEQKAGGAPRLCSSSTMGIRKKEFAVPNGTGKSPRVGADTAGRSRASRILHCGQVSTASPDGLGCAGDPGPRRERCRSGDRSQPARSSARSLGRRSIALSCRSRRATALRSGLESHVQIPPLRPVSPEQTTPVRAAIVNSREARKLMRPRDDPKAEPRNHSIVITAALRPAPWRFQLMSMGCKSKVDGQGCRQPPKATWIGETAVSQSLSAERFNSVAHDHWIGEEVQAW